VPAGPQALLASSNPHKLAELRAALPEWRIDLLPRDDYPAETGATYAENAALKARFGKLHAPDATWVIGEDSGIEAQALGGRPGVESARWAVDGVAALLSALDGVADRGARYVCTIVAVAPDGTEVEAVGTLAGSVLDGPPRGREGFGYDPIFVPDGERLTVAELGDAWKRLHSHRARAAAALAVAAAR
jgi:XTP/dITP diphosphohydrolase